MKIIVGMSGGVDSAVSAYLLKQQGHEVIGVFMHNWHSSKNNDILGNPNANKDECNDEQEWRDVQALGTQLGIETRKVVFADEYWDKVFLDLIEEYKKGRTPNPDILCNKFIKFGTFHDWVLKHYPDVDYIATGHYAQVENGILMKPKDSWKDQTYFLSQVSKEALARTLFPLGLLTKDEVRQIARDNKLVVANKKDSTGICFIGERKFTDFLQNYIPAQPGNIISIETNKVLGKHIGAMYYTLGQRKGLDLGGQSEPHYVCGHDLEKKVIYVAPESNKSYLLSDKAIITNMNWRDNKEDLDNIEVKFRYKSSPITCSIKWIDQDSLEVIYPEKFEAVTPGQQAVFYKDNICLGGGIIDKIFMNNKHKDFV